MLRSLHMKDVGPAAEMGMELSERLKVLTGDNGLGKSFVLEVAWWALTGSWVGKPAMPREGREDEAEIAYQLDLAGHAVGGPSRFRRLKQGWEDPVRNAGDIIHSSDDGSSPGWLEDYRWSPLIYARADGGFSVWDPARNYVSWGERSEVREPRPYHMSASQLWYGLEANGKVLCSGLLRDWTEWQLEARDDASHSFHFLTRILSALSHPEEPMSPGKALRLYHDDTRKYPSIDLPYGNVPVVHASAGMRRILGLAYLLAWAWSEHVAESKRLGNAPASSVVFLMDEIESHLHPKWQRVVPRAL
jgi:hypothetical protein